MDPSGKRAKARAQKPKPPSPPMDCGASSVATDDIFDPCADEAEQPLPSAKRAAIAALPRKPKPAASASKPMVAVEQDPVPAAPPAKAAGDGAQRFALPASERLGAIRSVLDDWGAGVTPDLASATNRPTGTSGTSIIPAPGPGATAANGATSERAALAAKALAARAAKRAAAAAAATAMESDRGPAPPAGEPAPARVAAREPKKGSRIAAVGHDPWED